MLVQKAVSRNPRAFSSSRGSRAIGLDADSSRFNPLPLTSWSGQDATRRPDRPEISGPRGNCRKITYQSPKSGADLQEPGPPARIQPGTRSDHPDDGSRASLTTTRKWSNSFRGRLARGGKLFPRARISEAASAAAAVVSPVTTATRGKHPRLSSREGKGPQLGRQQCTLTLWGCFLHAPKVSAAPGFEIGKGLGLSAGGARFSCLLSHRSFPLARTS